MYKHWFLYTQFHEWEEEAALASTCGCRWISKIRCLCFCFTVEPRIRFDAINDTVDLKAGSRMEVVCDVQSYPVSSIHWYREINGSQSHLNSCGKVRYCSVRIISNDFFLQVVYTCLAVHDTLGNTTKRLTVITTRKYQFVKTNPYYNLLNFLYPNYNFLEGCEIQQRKLFCSIWVKKCHL